MKLLILEFVTAGGLGAALDQPLCEEADGMIRTVAADFAALPGLSVCVPRCASLDAQRPLPDGVRRLPGIADPREDLSALLKEHDAVLLIAPETCGILHGLSMQVESLGIPLLGSTAAAVACAGDKWQTFLALAAAGIPQLPTCPVDSPWPHYTGPWVIKPADGCGCAGLQRFGDREQALAGVARLRADRAALHGSEPPVLLLAQPWMEGGHASLTVLGHRNGAELLAVNRQELRLADDGQVHLEGVSTGAIADSDGSLARLARAVHAAIPGLRGLFGIDVLLGSAGARVVEVNPRLTSAYPGLAQAIGTNPAQRWLASASPEPAAPPVPGLAVARPAAIVGWDLGGAHLKAAALDHHGQLIEALQRPCALWQGLDRLEPLLQELGTRWGHPLQHAVTMSGEMVDLFPDRSSGVTALVECFVRHAGGAPVRLYAGSAGFVTPDEVAAHVPSIASANWLALGDWAARHLVDGVVVDVGSTTCDVLAFADGRARPRGIGDRARLASGELVYTGAVRTPLMALCSEITLAGQTHAVMAEWFASSADVHRVLGDLPPDADLHPAEDGGSKDLDGSVRRLARMLGCDGPEYPLAVWQDVAQQFRARQLALIGAAIDRTLAARSGGGGLPSRIVVAGAGAFLARAACATRDIATISFGTLGDLIAESAAADTTLLEHVERSAPAVAVAGLLARQLRLAPSPR